MKTNNNKKELILTILAFLVLTLFGYFKFIGCNNKKADNSEIRVTSDTVTRISFDTSIIYIPHHQKSLTKSDTIYFTDTIVQNITVDTGAIVKLYLSCITSEYNYRNDTMYDLVITDSVCKGKLENRKISLKILRPDSVITITNNITKAVYPLSFFAGLEISKYEPVKIQGLLTKKKLALTAGYGFNTKELSIGVLYRLSYHGKNN